MREWPGKYGKVVGIISRTFFLQHPKSEFFVSFYFRELCSCRWSKMDAVADYLSHCSCTVTFRMPRLRGACSVVRVVCVIRCKVSDYPYTPRAFSIIYINRNFHCDIVRASIVAARSFQIKREVLSRLQVGFFVDICVQGHCAGRCANNNTWSSCIYIYIIDIKNIRSNLVKYLLA